MPLSFHTLLLSLEGGLLVFGHNYEGQLGLGHKKVQLQPAEVPWDGPQPVQVDCGWRYSLVLDVEGGVWQAGLSLSSFTFQRVLQLPCIVLVAAGESHCAAIDTEGGLWVWTSETDLSWARSLPQRVDALPPITKVACGLQVSRGRGRRRPLGVGQQLPRELGLGHTNSALQPTLVQVEGRSEGPLRCLAALYLGVILIDSQGGVFSSGHNSDGDLGRSLGDDWKLQQIMNIPPMLAASCGAGHTISLDENGDVWSWDAVKKGNWGWATLPISPDPQWSRR